MIGMDGGDRMRVTLLDRMSTVENGRSSVTLEDVLMAEMSSSRQQQPSPARNRILLDVMRRDRRRDKTTWNKLRDKLRLKRTSSTWMSHHPLWIVDSSSTTTTTAGDSSTTTTTTTPLDSERHRLGFLLSISESSEREEREREREREPARMSLMELLEDEDGTMYEVSSEEVAVVGERREETVELGCCCVCMTRSKGAAFVPCGHTFCRLCSRQLWVQRGNCPLCNTCILQVLDLF